MIIGEKNELDTDIENIINYEEAELYGNTINYKVRELNRAWYLLKEEIKSTIPKVKFKQTRKDSL